MADKNKLSKELEEQIQSLASEIYIQVEEKVANILSTTDTSISEQDIENHPLYLAAIDKQGELSQSLTKAEAELTTQQTTVTHLQQQLEVSEKNDATEALSAAKNKLEQLSEENSNLVAKEQNLIKADKAKTATLEVQNQQISDLNTKLNEATSALEHFQSQQGQQNEKVEAQLASEQQKSAQLVTENEALTSQLTTLKSSAEQGQQDLQDKMAQLEQANTELIQQLATVQQQADSAKTALEQQEQSTAVSEAQISNLTEQLTASEQLAVELGQTVDSQKAQIDELNTVGSDNASAAQQAQKEIASLNSQVESLQHQLEQVKSNQAEQVEALSAEHQDSIQKYQTETTNQQQQIDKLQSDKTELQRNIDVLQQHVTDFKDQTATLTEQLTLAQKQHESDQSAIDSLEQKLASGESQFTDQITALTDQVSALEKAASEANHKIEGQQHTIEQLNQQMQQAVSDQQRAEQKLISAKDKFEQDNNNTRETIKYLRDENMSLNSKHEQEVSELEDKIREFRLKFEYAQKQLQQG